MTAESERAGENGSRATRSGSNLSRTYRWLGLAAVVAVLDQATKTMAERSLELHVPMPVFPGLDFTLTYNRGAAFSLLSDAGGWQRWLFAVIAVAVCAFLTHWLYGLPRKLIWMPTAIALILGGALGNLYDRLLEGKVVDFVDVYYQGWHWPAFNLADSAICVGAIMLMVSIFRGDDRSE